MAKQPMVVNLQQLPAKYTALINPKKPKRKTSAEKLEEKRYIREQEVRNNAARAALARLTGMRGMVAGSCCFDTRSLSPRIKGRVIRMLTNGHIWGGGEGAAVAELLNQYLKLGCFRTWGTTLNIPRSLLANVELVEELKGLVSANMASALLEQEKKQPHDRYSWYTPEQARKMIEGTYANNMAALTKSHHNHNAATLSLSEAYLVAAGDVVAQRTRGPEVVEQVAAVCNAIREGLSITFSFTDGTQVVGTINTGATS